MSNEAKMNLEEKLVQTIKSDSLMQLVGDEDAITELVKRAVTEALYQPRTVKDGHYHSRTVDSPVVEAARLCAEKAAEKIAAGVVEEAMANAKFKTAFLEVVVSTLPKAILSITEHQVRSVAEEIAADSANGLLQRLRDSGDVKNF